ncbi:xanthine dehydrogenase family protein molybdopterin-binding subunit [Streptomyces sp. AJS327]|uniref:xanthine dehydrogenase family protein molybdopterin-binding subunit n=1 Tax=Streptomyces sp. AJS327 TaxID=2545265 RepID=UPI0015DDA461|nr:xanthine dehydrogenase family protein molybdopterin-binding subunit [Streptomyces sp. AJS327]MBA0053968.1 xanthine dehydrogenase family protein molybdopterin-binding subunit [Streptomyces sp. AJS327]
MTQERLTLEPRSIGTSPRRLDGMAKATGHAPYAYEYDPVQLPAAAHVFPVRATVARGVVERIDATEALAVEGVLEVLTHENATRLADTDDGELAVLQTPRVAFRGQFVGAVIAETPEVAREAAGLVRPVYAEQPHETELRADSRELYTPAHVNPAFPTDTEQGDPEGALAASERSVDVTYRTPMEFNNPMEPHTTVAVWFLPDSEADGGEHLTLYDSTQGPHTVRATLAPLFGLAAARVRVVAQHVGGGFGSKGMPHAHNVLAALAARAVPGRPVKLALTRQQLFSLAGHRTPTVQRVRLGCDATGRLSVIRHDAIEHTSRVKEFAEQTAVATRMMYAAPHRSTSHRLAALDVPVPSWMRAPGEAPGMFALECALDELAERCGLDPIDLRIRNDPETNPDDGKPWSGRRLAECLRTGAGRFGWRDRAAPGSRREGDWLVGLGVAAATYPGYGGEGSSATVEHRRDAGGVERFSVRIGAADLGTGARTALSQIAADALDCPLSAVQLELGDTELPPATVAGGSSGITCWGSTIVSAARAFRAEHGPAPRPGSRTTADMPQNRDRERYSVHSFGAQFAEVRVHRDTGEIRVPRMLGVFSAGRIINPMTARSQFIGGMTWGLSMALFEVGVFDHRTGHVVNQDFAEYHIPSCADVGDIEAVWLDEEDPHANPMGSRGIGEIGIVGSPAAVVNAVYNATGVRVRELPVTPDKMIPRD